MVTLAERLSAVAPMPGPHRFYYGNSGAEAVECALKLARYHTGRQNIIAFFGAFHGRTMGALSLTASKPQQKRRFAPLVPGVTHVRYPYAYRGCPVAPQEEEAFALGCARYIEEKLFKTMLPPEEVAAIFVEPIQGEGGYVVAPTIFMQELRRICDRHGILLVADEVQSGAGRTGKWWAIQHTGVEPDMVCMAKGIASGMPLGICMTRAEIMDWKPGSHASTFGGNPVAIAAALATMDVLEREGIANAAKVGAAMMPRLRGWLKTHPIVGDVRGRGLMIGIEIVKDQKTREAAPLLRDRIVDLAFERGLLILGCGETSLRLAPPLVVQQGEVDVALDILEECIGIAQGEHNVTETPHQESVHASQSKLTDVCKQAASFGKPPFFWLVLEEVRCVGDGGTGAHGGGDCGSLGEHGIGGAGFARGAQMKLDAVGALGGERDGDGHQLLLQCIEGAGGEGCLVEGPEGFHLVGVFSSSFLS